MALTRETLPPGTVFADPYGHTLVVVSWIPQGASSTGVLVAADAQPDGTVGRRRFWRGTFLFTPDATEVGPGFKAFRPATFDHAADAVTVSTNAELATTDEHPRWSKQQYEGSADDFYDDVEALINPRPLDPHEALVVLVDALEEAAVRRVVSVDNGEAYAAAHPNRPPACRGLHIFETGVGGLRDPVARYRPDRDRHRPHVPRRRRPPAGMYGLSPEDAATVAARLRADLATGWPDAGSTIGARTARRGSSRCPTSSNAPEVAYNPNDCVEVRWAAPEGSDERSACRRRAPGDQRSRMEEYRSWFRDRRRPPR